MYPYATQRERQPMSRAALQRRRLVLGAAAGGLGLASSAVPVLAAAFPGAKAPELRQVVPDAVQAAIDASGLPATSFGLFVQTLERKPVPRPMTKQAARQALQQTSPQTSQQTAPLVSLNADQMFLMASTTKVVTSLAALDLLGPAYRWQTYAFLGGPLYEGKLLGDLMIVGGGDASLSADDLRAWFKQLQAQGLREVWGDIVLDRFAFRLQETDYANTPLPTPDRPHHARPDALMLDEGIMRVSLQGTPTRHSDISMSPPMAGLRVVNEVTSGRGCSAWAHVDQQGGDSRLVVRGQWSGACGGRQIAQLALPHAEFTNRAVAGLWRDSGGRLVGKVVDNKLSPQRETLFPRVDGGTALSPWAVHESQPLPQLVREMNKTSDNLAARNLLLSLVKGFPILAATLPDARQRVRDWLRLQGIAVGDIEVDNGSGLSRAERGKPRALVQLLRNSWNGKQFASFLGSLPIAGVDGTLSNRMTTGPATGRAYLKTGTLMDTRALAGYVRGASGKLHALAAFVNHADAAKATPALDTIVEWLAGST